jgi:predicted MPP superfamily phosphohydrolase
MRFAIFITIALSIWLAQHLYVGWRLWSLPSISTTSSRWVLVAALVLGFVSYPLGRILYGVGWHASGRALEYVGAVWMGTLFLLLAFLLISEIVTVGGWLLKPWIGSIRTAFVVLALVAAVFAFMSARLGPRIVRLDVSVPGLSSEADGLTIAHLSDIHLGTILGPHFLDRIVELTHGLGPDVVVITGDMVDGDAGVVEEMLPQMSALDAPRGVFTVLGNHEYYAGRDRSRSLFLDAGYTVLDNRAVEVAPDLYIAGVPDARGSAQTGGAEADLRAALAGVEPDDSVVLLQHSPEFEHEAAAAGVDLMLNGHTHGGQIWPFNFLVRKAYPHVAGVFRVGAMTQIVSRGTGQWGPPMRLFAPSEIYLITLRSN